MYIHQSIGGNDLVVFQIIWLGSVLKILGSVSILIIS